VLQLASSVSKTGVPEHAPEGTRDIPETAELLRKIAGDSVVLLKNEGCVLPLKKNKVVS
jgi:beta-glucosidase